MKIFVIEESHDATNWTPVTIPNTNEVLAYTDEDEAKEGAEDTKDLNGTHTRVMVYIPEV